MFQLRIDVHMNFVTELSLDSISTKVTLMKKLFNLMQKTNSQHRALLTTLNVESDSPKGMFMETIFQFIYLSLINAHLYYKIEFSFHL